MEKGRVFVTFKEFEAALHHHNVENHTLFVKRTSEAVKDLNLSHLSYESVFDGYLDIVEFGDLLEDLCTDKTDSETSKMLSDADVAAFFSIIDLDNDSRISLEEFRCAWLYWLRQILKPVKALVIVDVQNDFISGTLSLSNCPAGQDALPIVPVINSLLEQNLFDVVVYTLDWHPENHISFIENVGSRKIHSSSQVSSEDAQVLNKVVFEVDDSPREQIMWPKHCVQGSWGSQLHPDLKVVDMDGAYHVQKGLNPDVDSYSAFWDNSKLSKTELSSILSKHRVTDVYVCGLAFEVCVGFTAGHSVEHGFRTVFIEDASRGVNVDSINSTKEDLSAKGVVFASSSQVPSLTRAEQRPVSLAAQAAVNYKLAWKIVKGKCSTS